MAMNNRDRVGKAFDLLSRAQQGFASEPRSSQQALDLNEDDG